MKKLLVILGPNGVGKSTTAKKFVELNEKTAYLDAEWCRALNPFALTEATKQVVKENMYCLLRNYLYCNEINTVVFPYGWHGDRRQIYEEVVERLRNDGIDFTEYVIILKCSEKELLRRALQDGRCEERVKRGMESTFNFYDGFDYPIIDTTDMTPLQVVENIRLLIQ